MDKQQNIEARPGEAERPREFWRSVARPRWQDVAATKSRGGVAVVAGRGS